jgi:hypothetical protein
MSTNPPPQLSDKVRELTLSVGRVVKARAVVAHRRKLSGGHAAPGTAPSADSQDGAPEPAPQRDTVDAYGFALSVSPEQEAALARCAARGARQRLKWRDWPAGGALPPEERLKKLCRKGVPPELRPWVWTQVSGAAAQRRAHPAGYYAAAAAAGRAADAPFLHQIQLDVPRTFPSCAWTQSEVGQACLRRVLCAFARHHPRVGYCQGMNYVEALLLLALGHDEEGAFWVLACLIGGDDGILYADMYARDLAGCHVEMRSLRELVAAKLPALGAHLEALRCDMSILATDWFLCLFCTSLPAEAAARVWDALLLEGPKVLFRVALALLKMHEPALLAADNPGDLLRAARGAAAGEHDRDELLHVAFDGVGALPMGRIRAARDRNQRCVDLEFAGRELRANLRAAVRDQGYVLQEGGAWPLPAGAGGAGRARLGLAACKAQAREADVRPCRGPLRAEEELMREPDSASPERAAGWRGQLKGAQQKPGRRRRAVPRKVQFTSVHPRG